MIFTIDPYDGNFVRKTESHLSISGSRNVELQARFVQMMKPRYLPRLLHRQSPLLSPNWVLVLGDSKRT